MGEVLPVSQDVVNEAGWEVPGTGPGTKPTLLHVPRHKQKAYNIILE